MKVVIFLLLASTAFSYDYDEIVEKCREANDIDEATFKKLHDNQAVERSELKCFAACFLEEYDIMDPSGKISADKYREASSTKNLNIEMCLKYKSNDKCKYANMFYDCYVKLLHAREENPEENSEAAENDFDFFREGFESIYDSVSFEPF